MNTRVILLRHGESTYNTLGLYQGSSDESVLTATGRQQARMTGAFLKNITFDAIYSSSLKRARGTAREVLEAIDPQLDPTIIKVDERLREADLPAWQGVAFQQVRSQFADDYRCWKQTPQNLKMELPQTGEYIYPARDLFDRVLEFWQEILPRYENCTLLLVTHGGTNRALISTALGISPRLFHTIQQSNCGISILNFSESKPGKASLEALNLATQSGETIPKLKEGGKGRRLLLVPSGNIHPLDLDKLTRLLAKVAIDFSLCDDLDLSHHLADTILKNRPETIQLRVNQENFGSLWQNNLSANNKNHDRLITGLVVASAAQISNLFAEIFDFKSDRVDRLQLQPGTLSAVHYPNSNHPPIVQAINILGFNPPQLKPSVADNTILETSVARAIA